MSMLKGQLIILFNFQSDFIHEMTFLHELTYLRYIKLCTSLLVGYPASMAPEVIIIQNPPICRPKLLIFKIMGGGCIAPVVISIQNGGESN